MVWRCQAAQREFISFASFRQVATKRHRKGISLKQNNRAVANTAGRGYISLALLACLLGYAATSWAQDEDSADTYADTIPVGETEAPAARSRSRDSVQLDKLEVTGSRLRRTDMETAQPVVVISREDILRSGLTDISELLRNLTAAGNNSLSAQQGRFALTMGETNLDLRNLGATHTLLLVNGRRWVTGLIQTQTSVSDYNTIPTAIIERVEILKDGASAIYGSDAIGGVVNVITRKDFDGGEFSYHFGQYLKEGDGLNQQASLSWGTNTARTNVYMNLNYTDQDRAPNENRPLTAAPLAGSTRNSIVSENGAFLFVDLDSVNAARYGCPNLQAGILAGALGEPTTGGPIRQTQMVPAGLVLCSLTLNDGAQGGPTNPFDYHQIDNTNPDDTYNRFADGTLKEPNERLGYFMQLEHQWLDNVSLNFETLYNRRSSISVGQNAYLSGGNLDGGLQGHLANISASNPTNPFAQDIGFDSSCGGPSDSGADPNSPSCTGIGDGTGVWAIRRAPGLNNDNYFHTVDTIRLGGGLSGEFELLDLPLLWDGGYIYSRSKIEQIFPAVHYERAAEALGNSGPCEAPCVPLNVFQGAANLDPAAVDYIRINAWQRNRTQQDMAYLNLTGELPLASEWLPGPLAVALGWEYRKDFYASDVDEAIQQGLIRTNQSNPLSGATYAREAYMELGLPLARDLPGAYALDLDLAGRYSRYPRIGGITTGKAGLRWQPFEQLLVRGTYSTGFRAPNVGELFLGASQSFDPLLDPCADPGTNDTADQNCLADGTPGGGDGGNLATPYDLWRGNPDLQPEKSKNLTYGFIYSPGWLPDLNIGVDFYKITIDDYVVIGQGQFFLDSCYKTEERNYCDSIHRNGLGSLTYVDTPYFNLSKVDTSGIDLGLDYVLPFPEGFGQVKLTLDGSYLTEFKTTAPRPGQADEVVSEVGTVDGQFFGYPRWKAGGHLNWKWNNFKATWSTRMAYHMTEPCGDLFPAPSLKDLGLCSHPDVVDEDGNSAPENRLHTLFYHNLQLAYEFREYDADISLGINNVLNQDPRVSRGLASLYWYNFDPNHYEAPGRFSHVRVSFRF